MTNIKDFAHPGQDRGRVLEWPPETLTDIEVEMKNLGGELQLYGSFENTPDGLLGHFADLCTMRTLAAAREEWLC